jgi:type II secretion system protein H
MTRLPMRRGRRAATVVAASEQQGFTLIEVLVVVFIIGIIVTFATLSIGDRVLSDRLETEAQRLRQLFEMAGEDAEMHGTEIGFVYTDRGYAFVTAGPNGRWAPIPSGPFRPREIKAPITLALKVEGRNVPPTPLAELVAAGRAALEEADPAKTAPAARTDAGAGAAGLIATAQTSSRKDHDKQDNEGKDEKDDKDQQTLKPQALLLSSGEATAMSVLVSAPGVATTYQVDVDNLGRGRLTTLDSGR